MRKTKNIEKKSKESLVYNLEPIVVNIPMSTVEAIDCLIYASRTGLIFKKKKTNANK